MNHLRRTKSHIWNFSIFRLRHRTDSYHPRTPRTLSNDHKSVSSDVWVDAIEDQRDGFYRYSELHEESLEGPLADIMRQNDNLDENSEFYLVVLITPSLTPCLLRETTKMTDNPMRLSRLHR